MAMTATLSGWATNTCPPGRRPFSAGARKSQRRSSARKGCGTSPRAVSNNDNIYCHKKRHTQFYT